MITIDSLVILDLLHNMTMLMLCECLFIIMTWTLYDWF